MYASLFTYEKPSVRMDMLNYKIAYEMIGQFESKQLFLKPYPSLLQLQEHYQEVLSI